MFPLPSLQFLITLSNFISRSVKVITIIGAILLFCVQKYTSLWSVAISNIYDLIVIFRGDIVRMGSANFATLDYISYVNGVLPLAELVGLFTTYTALWLLIITIRWIKSFIPTMSN